MDSKGQIVKDYKERKIEVSEAVDRLRALDKKNPPHIDKNLSMEEKKKEVMEILERLEDEDVLDIMCAYAERLLEEEQSNNS
mgnify:CR=1 FL=1|jgi:hypothetical protein